MTEKRLVKVQFLKSPVQGGKKEFLFTTLKAIFSQFTREDVGLCYAVISRKGVRQRILKGEVFRTSKCKISIETVNKNK